jgi:hypothetical protein
MKRFGSSILADRRIARADRWIFTSWNEQQIHKSEMKMPKKLGN